MPICRKHPLEQTNKKTGTGCFEGYFGKLVRNSRSLRNCVYKYQYFRTRDSSSPCARLQTSDFVSAEESISSKSSDPKMLSQLLTENYDNFKRSKEPVQIMYYANGSWVSLAQPDAVEKLRSGFLTGTGMVEVVMAIDDEEEEETDRRYLFDFFRMLQVDLFTGVQRSIAWIDVAGNCFFPKRFIDDSRNDGRNLTMKLEIEVKLVDCSESCGNYESDQKMKNKNSRTSENVILKLNLGKKQKNVVVHIEGSGGKLEREEGCMSSNNGSNTKRKLRPGKSWNKMEEGYESSTDNGGRKRRCAIISDNRIASRWPNAALISEASAAYELVKKFFLSGVVTLDPTATITSIHKCVYVKGAAERARRALFSKQMEIVKGLRGASNTVFAWYGTSAKEVETIVSHGFSTPTEASRTEEAFGVGVYLTPVSLPHLSAEKLQADDNGEKHVVLCRVILGNVEILEAGSQQSHSSDENFDTGADDLKNPKRYVVWCSNMNSHILPECVVSYKSSDHLSGHPRRPGFAKWLPRAPNSAFTNLFSRLERSLPSELGQSLRTLCSTYKAGQLRKDNFIKQLRATVGDKLLRSTITQMRRSN